MFSIPETAVPLDLATITLRILRPTTLLPQTWDTATSLRITLSLLVDGVEHRVVAKPREVSESVVKALRHPRMY